MIKRINELIRDIDRNGHSGMGKPEPLRGNWSGWWSRRISDKDRLIYRIEEDKIIITACRHHYGEK